MPKELSAFEFHLTEPRHNCERNSSKHDFDYLVGNWNIRNRTLKEPLVGSDEWEEFDATQEFRLVLLGQGNFDIFRTKLDGKPFEGLTVRLFDPQTRLWTIYWADSNAMKLDDGKVGSFDGDEGDFFGREVIAGKDVIVKFHWDSETVYSFSPDALGIGTPAETPGTRLHGMATPSRLTFGRCLRIGE